MKKMKALSLLFALLLLLNMGCPAYAAQAPEETTAATEETLPQETEPISAAPGLSNSVTGFDAGFTLPSSSAPELTAAAALLYEMNSGTMVYGYNIDVRVYPASLTKIMTCLVAIEQGNLEDTVTVTEEALSGMHPDGSNVGMQVGEEMSLREMLYCVMLASANDACPAVAEHIAGSEAAFVQLMNEKAQQLGCTGTHFANTHGLHDDEHYTTARDMLKIFSAALEYTFFQELYSTVRHTVPATNLSGERELSSTNYMINDDYTSAYLDERVEGGKTGFTTPAGRCFICTAKDGNLRYISIVLGAENEVTGSGVIVYHNFMDTETLLDYGFGQFSFVQAMSPLAPLGQLEVAMSPDMAVVAPSETVTALLPTDYDTTALETSFVLSDPNLTAPLDAQQQVGVAQLFYKNVLLAEAPLVTVNAVRENAIAYKSVKAAQILTGSPWRLVVLVLFVLLLIFLVLLLRAAILRRRMRRRRRQRRR